MLFTCPRNLAQRVLTWMKWVLRTLLCARNAPPALTAPRLLKILLIAPEVTTVRQEWVTQCLARLAVMEMQQVKT